jgi:hypothetical protein
VLSALRAFAAAGGHVPEQEWSLGRALTAQRLGAPRFARRPKLKVTFASMADVAASRAQIGSALGSMLGQLVRMADSRLRVIVACGTAGGIAATFNAPITGLFFGFV